MRKATGAKFVVVGDHEGKRYSHPVPERIGKFMVGGDNARALMEGCGLQEEVPYLYQGL